MKTIGLLGGMSWESTMPYYEIINRQVQKQCGGFSSAKILLYSVNFKEIEEMQQEGRWEEAGKYLGEKARLLEDAGAQAIVLCTNTMHKVAPTIQQAITVPFIHIATVTGEALKKDGIQKVGLLGTAYTMEQDFYIRGIEDMGIQVLVPPKAQREQMNNIIFQQLVLGEFLPESRKTVVDIIEDLAKKGAEGIILGCTEIGLLVKPTDTQVPLYDTTEIHALAAGDFAVK